MRHEVEDLATRLRSTVDTIEFQRAQPPVVPPPQWYTHNPWAPIFPGHVAMQTPPSIGFAQTSHNPYSGLQDFLLVQMQQHVQQRLHAMEAELMQTDQPQLGQPSLPQQDEQYPPRRRLPEQLNKPLPRQASPRLPEQPGGQDHMVQGKGRWVSLLRSPKPTEPGRNLDRGRPREPMIDGKPTQRQCRFRAKCWYKDLHCPFQHTKPTEAGPQPIPESKPRQTNLRGSKSEMM